MNKRNILMMMLALAVAFAMPTVSSAQKKDMGETPAAKQEKMDLLKEHKAALEVIENDATLSQSEKEELIKQKKIEFRNNIDKRGPASKYGKKGKKGKRGKFESEEAREEWKKNKEAISKEIEAIENDSNLTEEEKELKKRELLNKKIGEKRRKGRKGDAYKKMNEEERSAKRAERKAHLEEIKNDPNLTEEEKKAKKKAYIKEVKKTAAVKGRKGDMYRGKGYETHGTKKGRKESSNKGAKGKGFAKKDLTVDQKEKAIAALKRSEDRLAKDLTKGKITQERYDTRIAKINQVRERILKN